MLEKSLSSPEDITSCKQTLFRLDDLSIDFNTLEQTRIGVIVGRLRRHADGEISSCASMLVEKWKKVVQEHTTAGTKPKSDDIPRSKEGESKPDRVNKFPPSNTSLSPIIWKYNRKYICSLLRCVSCVSIQGSTKIICPLHYLFPDTLGRRRPRQQQRNQRHRCRPRRKQQFRRSRKKRRQASGRTQPLLQSRRHRHHPRGPAA